MKYFKFSAITILFALAVFIGCKRDASLLQQSDEVPGASAPKKTKMDVPTITCTQGSTQVSISLEVCAGATGTPAGFSMPMVEYGLLQMTSRSVRLPFPATQIYQGTTLAPGNVLLLT